MVTTLVHREAFEIAIICVLEIEGDAVEAHMTEKFTSVGKAAGDSNFYVTGVLGGKIVVLVAPRGMGTLNAANTVRDMRHSFPAIKLALLTGVAGGAPQTPQGEEILLGDVLLSSQVIQYDFGSHCFGGIRMKTDTADTLGRPSLELANFLRHLRRRSSMQILTRHINESITDPALYDELDDFRYPGHGNDRLFPSTYPHRHRGEDIRCQCKNCTAASDEVCGEAERARCDTLQCEIQVCVRRDRIIKSMHPTDIANGLSQRQLLEKQGSDASDGPALPVKVHFGTIASASQVLKNSAVRDQVAVEKGVIGFEMEGAGCWDTFPTIVVKSVCDYADGHKDKRWQPYASAVAACRAKAIVEQWQTSQTVCHETVVGLAHGASSKAHVAPSYALPEQHATWTAILKGLFVTNPLDDLYVVKQGIRHGLGHAAGTCQWITKHQGFLEWLSRPAPQVFSLIGPPGIGKSTLSTFVVSHLQGQRTDHGSRVAFFFCDATVKNRRTYLAVVKGLL